MQIIKRDGSLETFFTDKIVNAITGAMDETEKGVDFPLALKIAKEIQDKYSHDGIRGNIPTVEIVQDDVEYYLMESDRKDVAKKYILYREDRNKLRQINTTDESILGLLDFTNAEVMKENSNKNPNIISTQRDLIAGEISKDIVKRKLLPFNLSKAHEEGKIHIHDMDYLMQSMINCCLPNIKDMLENGTVINGKQIDSPKSFRVACTVMTQIVAQISSNQYGGQSISSVDTILAPFVRLSYNKHFEKYENRGFSREYCEKYAEEDTREEVKDGVQTIQYQINTLMTTNGQSPFLTLLLHFEDGYEFEEEASIIQEEILKQRIEGIKNEVGEWVTPAFPKLIYVLDEHNVHEDSKYYYITKLAGECTSKRMYPKR